MKAIKLLPWDEVIELTESCIPDYEEYKDIILAIQLGGHLGWEKLMRDFDKQHLAFVKTISMIESSSSPLSDWVTIRELIQARHGCPLNEVFLKERYALDTRMFKKHFLI